MLLSVLCGIFLAATTVYAQLGPEVTSWIVNTTGDTGYNNIPSNVQQVQYSDNNVYVSATCIPAYDIGPWASNPNTPRNQNFVFKVTRHPAPNTGTSIATPMGHIGVWTNGVSVFNAKDGFSYNSQNVWFQDAFVYEGKSFDDCLGHPAPNGEYHHHINPTCLYDDTDSQHHSPIIGYAFDGFPIYGAYGFAGTDGSGAIVRMKSSYQLRAIAERTSLPDGTQLTESKYGPAVSEQYPLGSFLEDYEYVESSGDLDEHNGRFCSTPDYPNGTYAYFITLNDDLYPVYPYVVGPTYYGTVPSGNTGPGSGHVSITEAVQTYTPAATGVWGESIGLPEVLLYPTPADSYIAVHIAPIALNNFTADLYTIAGARVLHADNIQPANTYSIDVSQLSPGVYTLVLTAMGRDIVRSVVIR